MLFNLQVGYVEMVMPNIHYFTVNMAPFGIANKDEVRILMKSNISMLFH